MLRRFIFTALASVIAIVMSGCNKKTESAHPVSQPAAVTISSGYVLPTLLAEPMAKVDATMLPDLLKRKWYAEFNVYEESQPKTTFTLSNCEQYLSHSKQKLWTVVEKENAPFMELAVMCRATQAMLAAKKVEKSFLQDIQFDPTLPDKLPAKFAMVISLAEQQRLAADTSKKLWRDVLKITKTEITGEKHAKYSHDGGMQELEQVARGDFNGDGIEDMLITSRDSVEGGSYSAIRLFMVTKKSEAGAVELIE